MFSSDHVDIQKVTEPVYNLMTYGVGKALTCGVVEANTHGAVGRLESSIVVQPLQDEWWDTTLLNSDLLVFGVFHPSSPKINNR